MTNSEERITNNFLWDEWLCPRTCCEREKSYL